MNPKTPGRKLVSEYDWRASEGTRICAVGPEPLGIGDGTSERPTCLLIESTFGLQIPQDARENITTAFKYVIRKGVLVNAPHARRPF
jgi:hypothetical protein